MFKRKGGGVKGILNNVKKTALFLKDGFPNLVLLLVLTCFIFISNRQALMEEMEEREAKEEKERILEKNEVSELPQAKTI